MTNTPAKDEGNLVACVAGARKGKGNRARAMLGGGRGVGGRKRLQLSHCLFVFLVRRRTKIAIGSFLIMRQSLLDMTF